MVGIGFPSQGTTIGLKLPNGATRPALSKRQEEILLAASLGTPDKLIAEELQVSTRTLEGHWRAIHRKLGSLNRCQAGFLFAALRENTHGNSLA
jgi:DNA-binding NarL/FixJ family response regulator